MREPALAANLVRRAERADRRPGAGGGDRPRAARRAAAAAEAAPARRALGARDAGRHPPRPAPDPPGAGEHGRRGARVGHDRPRPAGGARARSRCATAPCSSGRRPRRSPRRTSRRSRDARPAPAGPRPLAQRRWGTAGGTRRRHGRGVELALRAGGRPARAVVGQRADGPGGAGRGGRPRGASRASCASCCCSTSTRRPSASSTRTTRCIGAQARRRPGLRAVRRGTVTQALLAALAAAAHHLAGGLGHRVAHRGPGRAGLRRPAPAAHPGRDRGPLRRRARPAASRRAGPRPLARLVRTLDPESLRDHGTAAARPGCAASAAGRLVGRRRGHLGLGRLDLGLAGDLGLIRVASRLTAGPRRRGHRGPARAHRQRGPASQPAPARAPLGGDARARRASGSDPARGGHGEPAPRVLVPLHQLQARVRVHLLDRRPR